MHSSSSDILEAALKLPEGERLFLIERLIESVPDDPLSITLSLDDPNLKAELDRRFHDDNGSIPWSELRDEG